MTIILRPHQIAAADAVENAWRSGVRRPLVNGCVSSGKSLMMAEISRRALARGARTIITAHTPELVTQTWEACRSLMPDVHIGINAATLGERTWRAPVICAMIQSVHRHAASFGPITNLLGDECHLWPHAESGMHRTFARDLGDVFIAGFSGTTFRLQGGSLVEGEGAPFDREVFTYGILDGIRDGYLCPAFSLGADDKIDVSKLRTRQGEYTAESSDAQMIAAMDNHILQMVHHGADRKAWLIFEAGTKSAAAMAARMNEWGIPTGLVLGSKSRADIIARQRTVEQYRAGRLRALVNVQCLTTGFDVPQVDLLVLRRPTKSLGLYVQICGRALRTVGGNIEASIAAGKSDAAVLDFAGLIDAFGPLDFIRPKQTVSRLVSCDACGKRNAAAAARCWSCNELMTKNCPACLTQIAKGTLDCPECGFDMRTGGGEAARPAKLFDVPSGAALIRAWAPGKERQGGWLPVVRAWQHGDGHAIVQTGDNERHELRGALAGQAAVARWLRLGASGVAILVPNGPSRSSARQISADGAEIIVPLPAMVGQGEAA